MTNLRSEVAKRVGSALQSPLVTQTFRLLTGHQLRVLAFHGVDDLTYFESLVARVVSQYHPVDGDDIAAALDGIRRLPHRSVWFTFDDGLLSTLKAADVLATHGVRATVFVNPASYEEPSLLWFQVLELAEQRQLISPHEADRFSRKHLKTCPDHERRAAIAELEQRLGTRPDVPASMSGNVDDLGTWVAAGHEVGNHTWDHPCLDTCEPEDQVGQVTRAHDWLVNNGFSPRFFAYPNGNWAVHSEEVAQELGYVASVLFDHRLTKSNQAPHRLSRLRISSDASTGRIDSILSGAHSTMYHAHSVARSQGLGRIIPGQGAATNSSSHR